MLQKMAIVLRTDMTHYNAAGPGIAKMKTILEK
jgi:hypothetical protein